MPLLITVVLWDVVEIVPSDDDGTVHFGRDHSSREDTAADRDETSEWALFIYTQTPTPPPYVNIRTTRITVFFFSFLSFIFIFFKYLIEIAYRCRFPQWRSWGS